MQFSPSNTVPESSLAEFIARIRLCDGELICAIFWLFHLIVLPKTQGCDFHRRQKRPVGKKSIEILLQNHAALSIQMLFVWHFIHVVSLGLRLFGQRTMYLNQFCFVLSVVSWVWCLKHEKVVTLCNGQTTPPANLVSYTKRAKILLSLGNFSLG